MSIPHPFAFAILENAMAAMKGKRGTDVLATKTMIFRKATTIQIFMTQMECMLVMKIVAATTSTAIHRRELLKRTNLGSPLTGSEANMSDAINAMITA